MIENIEARKVKVEEGSEVDVHHEVEEDHSRELWYWNASGYDSVEGWPEGEEAEDSMSDHLVENEDIEAEMDLYD